MLAFTGAWISYNNISKRLVDTQACVSHNSPQQVMTTPLINLAKLFGFCLRNG
jgi:hypothetical protein